MKQGFKDKLIEKMDNNKVELTEIPSRNEGFHVTEAAFRRGRDYDERCKEVQNPWRCFMHRAEKY